MKLNNLLNMAWMQVLWFGAIIGAADDLVWPAPVLLIAFAIWESRAVNAVDGDFKLTLVAVVIGLILDTTWIQLGWLEYATPWPAADIAPLWILLLWAGLALTLNHSLAWLQSRLWLAALLSGLASPFSYLAATKLGGVQIITESWLWLIGLGVSWAIALPALLWLAGQWNQTGQEVKNYE